MVFLILSAIILLIILIILIYLRKRIKIAIELIEEGSIAIGHIMSTLFFPIVPFIWQALLLAWFLVVATYLASSGEAQYKIDLEDCGGKNKSLLNIRMVRSYFLYIQINYSFKTSATTLIMNNSHINFCLDVS